MWVLDEESNTVAWGTEEWVRLQALWLNWKSADGYHGCTGLVQSRFPASRDSLGNNQSDKDDKIDSLGRY